MKQRIVFQCKNTDSLSDRGLLRTALAAGRFRETRPIVEVKTTPEGTRVPSIIATAVVASSCFRCSLVFTRCYDVKDDAVEVGRGDWGPEGGVRMGDRTTSRCPRGWKAVVSSDTLVVSPDDRCDDSDVSNDESLSELKPSTNRVDES